MFGGRLKSYSYFLKKKIELLMQHCFQSLPLDGAIIIAKEIKYFKIILMIYINFINFVIFLIRFQKHLYK